MYFLNLSFHTSDDDLKSYTDRETGHSGCFDFVVMVIKTTQLIVKVLIADSFFYCQPANELSYI
jgi:hypothetical protein